MKSKCKSHRSGKYGKYFCLKRIGIIVYATVGFR